MEEIIEDESFVCAEIIAWVIGIILVSSGGRIRIIFNEEKKKHFIELDNEQLSNRSVEQFLFSEDRSSRWQVLLSDFASDVLSRIRTEFPKVYTKIRERLFSFGKEKIFDEWMHNLWEGAMPPAPTLPTLRQKSD